MKTLTNKEIITISGSKDCPGENNCWCAHSQPTDLTYIDGACIGWAAHEEACQSECAEAGYKWATYDFIGLEGADDSKSIIHTLSGLDGDKNEL